MRRFAVLISFFVVGGCGQNSPAPEFSTSEYKPGGEMTAKYLSDRSFIYPGPNADRMTQLQFWTGFSLFRDPWVIAPSSTKDRDGLGPLFNTRSCVSCHDAGSRANLPGSGEFLPQALVIRLGSMDETIASVDPIYGGQIQPRAINVFHTNKDDRAKAEAWLELTHEVIEGEFADGESYRLQKPNYQLTKLAYGELAPHVGLSPRHAPNVFGMGLLDAIATKELLAQEDTDDNDNDGISAVYNRVPNHLTGELQLGRFGFKAKHPNLQQQVAAAFRDDIGITSEMFPDESCTSAQVDCSKVAALGEHEGVELPNKLLNLVTSFNQLLAVQPARNLDETETLAGRALFYRLQCQTCHTPSYTTEANYPIKALAGQEIWPYTDLALHDMGPELADGVFEFEAKGNEWRTPPLWGIGLQEAYTGQKRYLHDGRARSIEEAILWHGGEAESSKQNYIKLNRNERKRLQSFLRSI